MGQSHSQSQTHISVLPNEVMFIILQYLPPQEMKSAVLVCKALREMGEKPRFWTWAVATVNTKDDLLKLKLPRLQMVQEIDVTHPSRLVWMKREGLADLFQVIGEIPTVRRIRGLEFCKGIEGIEPDLVVSVLNSLEELNLCYDFYDEEDFEDMPLRLEAEQLELLFTAVAEKTNLKFLQVGGQLTEEISPELFAAAVSNVEEVKLENLYEDTEDMEDRDITDKHFEALYSIIAAEDRPLRKFTSELYYINDESAIDPDLLSRAYNRLEEVDTDVRGSAEQLTAILRGLVEGDSRLKRLMFSIDLGKLNQIDQNLVRRAKEKFGQFYEDS